MRNSFFIGWVIFLGITTGSCTGKTEDSKSDEQVVNPADTIYLGDLREKFVGDSLFFMVVAPDLILDNNQYFWTVTESSALEKGLTKEYYKKVKQEISATNNAIRRGVMKGADVKRIYDFIRGLSPYPAAWSELVQPDGETVVMKIFETEKIIQSHQLTPGTLLTDGKTYIHVAAADGIIGIRALQLPGKKRLKTDELLRGFRLTEEFRVK